MHETMRQAGEPRSTGQDPDLLAADHAEIAKPRARDVLTAAQWIPAATVAAVVVVSLARNGVSAAEMFAYSVYWVVALIVPGTLVFRALVGSREFLVEDLAFGAVTGLALEITAWLTFRAVGLDGAVRWWWLLPLAVFATVPSLRQFWAPRFESAAHSAWSWAMAAVSVVIVMSVDLGAFRRNPLPPAAGTTYVDMWWHLALVEELKRAAPAQTPQVAGEPLAYHFYSHAHMAVASTTSMISPQIVLFRLWLIPVILTAVGLMAAFARELTGKSWTGPLAVWLTTGALAGGYLWSDFPVLSTTPFRIASPSQILAMPLVFGAAWAIVRLIRGELPRYGWVWLGCLAVVGSGTKPTVVPTLLGGTVLAFLAVYAIERRFPRQLALCVGGLFLVQAWSMTTDLEGNSSTITLFGTLKSLRIYQDLTGDSSLRAVNDGLILDSLTGSTALLAASATIVVLLGTHIFHLVGTCALGRRDTRRDGAAWWLAGAMATGWLVLAVLDHSAFGQLYFFHIAVPFGLMLSVWLGAVSVADLTARWIAGIVAAGLAAGAVFAIAATAFTGAASEAEGFGLLDQVVVPLAFALLAVVLGAVIWRSLRSSRDVPKAGLALCLSAIVGVSVPTSIDYTSGQMARWMRTPELAADADDNGYLSAGEQSAAIWLKENSSADDVVATNTQCRPMTTDLNRCNAVGFWVGGLAGRRVVLEGWGYTPETHAAHGTDGKHRNRQPPPWPERYERSIGAIESPTPEGLDELRQEYGTSWLFAARRAGPVSERLWSLAEPVFDNGEVAIFRLD